MILIIFCEECKLPITVSVLYKARNILARSNTGAVSPNTILGMDVYVISALRRADPPFEES
jgi:hypothetical protein